MDDEKYPDKTYKDIYKILFDIQRETRAIKNKTVQLCWEYLGFESEYKKKYGLYPVVSDIMPLKTLSGNINANLKNQFKSLYSGNLSTTIRNVCADFNKMKKDIICGKTSVLTFKDNQPLDLHNKSIAVKKDEQKWYADLSLMSTAFKKENKFDNCKLSFRLIVKDKSTQVILERCFDKIYNITASQITYNNKKRMWFLNLGYAFESGSSNDFPKDNIMGVDLGIAYPAYVSYNCSSDRSYIEGTEIASFRKQIENRRKHMLKQGKYCGEGRNGHGVSTKIKPTDNLQDKIKNFRDTTNHKYSKYIVEQAVKHNCGTIQIEDLSGIASKSSDSVNERFLKYWTYFDLQAKTEYKAKALGIDFVKVKPSHTSQRCSQCGYIDSENRKNQKDFVCLKCGFSANADFNASQNIATKNISEIIEKTILQQKMKVRNISTHNTP